jgi:hypothetical protein
MTVAAMIRLFVVARIGSVIVRDWILNGSELA